MKTMIIGDWEYETETHDKGKTLANIPKPIGWELWTYKDVIDLLNSEHREKLNLLIDNENDFFFEQPIQENKNKGLVAVAIRVRDSELDLVLDREPSIVNGELGVRFKRRIKEDENYLQWREILK